VTDVNDREFADVLATLGPKSVVLDHDVRVERPHYLVNSVDVARRTSTIGTSSQQPTASARKQDVRRFGVEVTVDGLEGLSHEGSLAAVEDVDGPVGRTERTHADSRTIRRDRLRYCPINSHGTVSFLPSQLVHDR